MLGRGTLGACNSAGGEVEVCLLKILEEVSYFFSLKKNSFTIMDKNKAYAKHSVSSFVFTPKKKERKKKKKDYGAHYR